jgi:membrane dipeptidase
VPTAKTEAEAAEVGSRGDDQGVVVDAHVHSPTFLPPFAARVFAWFTRRTRPRDVGFEELTADGVNAVVANAVGDLLVTLWWLRSPWDAVTAQLEVIRRQTMRAGGVMVTSSQEMRDAAHTQRPAVMLGLEGANVIGEDLDRLDQLFEAGVRVITPVHLSDNRIGTTCLPWQQYIAHTPMLRRSRVGLTEFGRHVIDRMNRLGILVDVSHADKPTAMDIIKVTSHPVVATHSGAAAVQSFERFLDDEQITAISSTGGVIGLWPYRYKNQGAVDLNELMRHARHIADLVGARHLCLGTDMNGVPGLTAGYRGEHDVQLLPAHLRSSGFSTEEVVGVMGENFLRVLDAINPTLAPETDPRDKTPTG